VLAELEAQDFFGDRALVTNEPRMATVVAIDSVEVYTVGRETFRQYEAISRPFIERIQAVYGGLTLPSGAKIPSLPPLGGGGHY
jgi:CRP-like cAMP-binding protein